MIKSIRGGDPQQIKVYSTDGDQADDKSLARHVGKLPFLCLKKDKK